MQTPNLVDKNVEQMAGLFPEVITEIKDKEGNIIKGIDFDLLKQKLSSVLVEDENERYRLDWPGKKASLLKANTPIAKTLRPVEAESVNFNKTENLYIEGDNFEVLKILQESYLGKVKMIYIDPPYNTGNDFIYKDDFRKSTDEYEEVINATDEEGGRLFKNTDTNGRFHSDWLSMIYERLIVAKDMLTSDGVIFISIDDSEFHNLRKMADEIFGEENFVGNMIWQSRTSISNDQEISLNHNHTLVFSKNIECLRFYGIAIDPAEYSNPDDDPRGPWKLTPLDANKPGGDTRYPIKNPNTGEDHFPPNGRSWSINKADFQKLLDDGRIKFGINGDSSPKRKLFYNERLDKGDTKTPSSIILDAGTTKTGTTEMMNLFAGQKLFDYPKPTTLIKRFLSHGCGDNKNCIVLDYFSGSASTAHAVMEYNIENTSDMNFIMVQLPENLEESIKTARGLTLKTTENAIAFLKANKKPCVISEIGKERIRRAGEKIKEEFRNKYTEELEKVNKELSQGSLLENKELQEQKSELESKIEHVKNLDIGFRVYKTDSSNMKDVFYHPTDIKQEKLSTFVSNIKEDRTPEDLLTQVMLDLGLELSLSIDKREILGNSVFVVQENALVACFDDNINFGIVDVIADLKPFKVVFKDASFADDKDRINVEERFKRLSPETVITVI